MMKTYILDGHTPKLEPDIEIWAKWMSGNCVVAQNKFVDSSNPEEKKILVSTMFLGLDHSFHLSEYYKPLLFRTLIFGGAEDQYQDRCSTWDEALIMHQKALDLVMKEINK